MNTTLSSRIAAALTGETKSGDVKALLDETISVIADCSSQLEQHRAVSLDPTSTDEKVGAARQALSELEFNVQRMSEAERRLVERHAELVAAEEAAAEAARNAARSARQAKIREQFNTEYPIMAQRIAAMAAEMVAAGIERELPHIQLGDGPLNQSGPGFNYRRYWPLPQQAYEKPEQAEAPTYAGKVVILDGKNGRAA